MKKKIKKFYSKEYYIKNREKIKKKNLEYYYKNREKILAYQKKRWKIKYQTDESFKEKRRFRDRSRNKIDKYKPIDVECSVCGDINDLQRHHPNYEELDFIIVCRSYHNDIHQSFKEGNKNIQSIQVNP